MGLEEISLQLWVVAGDEFLHLQPRGGCQMLEKTTYEMLYWGTRFGGEIVMAAGWLDWMILMVFSNLGDSMISQCEDVFYDKNKANTLGRKPQNYILLAA